MVGSPPPPNVVSQKTLFLVNQPGGVGDALEVRDTEWQLSVDSDRGHPMIARRAGGTYSSHREDYFRRNMARYYGFLAGSSPDSYGDFGYLMSESPLLYEQASTSHNVAFNIVNSQDFRANQIAPYEDQIGYDDNNLMVDAVPLAVDWMMDWAFAGIEPGASSADLLGLGIKFLLGSDFHSALVHNQGTIGGPILYAPETWSWFNFMRPHGVGYEHETLEIVGDADEWAVESQSKNLTNMFEDLFNEPYWTNWQAYVMGGAWVSSEQAQNQWVGTPGLFGSGMQNKIFQDFAFSRPLLQTLDTANMASSDYNYSSVFFDTAAYDPTMRETYIPNFYLVNSIMHNSVGDPMWPQLFLSGPPAIGRRDDSAVSETQLILSRSVGATVSPSLQNPAINILEPAYINSFTPLQVAATNQEPNSLLSRMTRKDFSPSNELAELDKINRHIGIPKKMLQAPTSMVTEMNLARESLFPYNIRVQFPTYSPSTTLIENFNLANFGVACDDSMSNFFLYEIMKANIFNFEDRYSDDRIPLDNAPTDPGYLYENINFAAVRTEPDVPPVYSGFSGIAEQGSWSANSPNALEPYSLRAIDFSNLFANFFRYYLRPGLHDYPEQVREDDYYGSYGNYSGFVGQTYMSRLADGMGIIVGTSISSLGSDHESGQTGSLLNPEYFTSVGPGRSPRWEFGFSTNEEFFETQIQMSDWLSSKMRNYYEMVTGTEAYRETLVFKVDKHSVGSDLVVSEKPLQSIYFSNTIEGLSEIDYVDTQVLRGKKYLYKIYSYDLVVGNEYKYTNPEVFPPIASSYPNPLARMLDLDSDQSSRESVNGSDILATAATWPHSTPGSKFKALPGIDVIGAQTSPIVNFVAPQIGPLQSMTPGYSGWEVVDPNWWGGMAQYEIGVGETLDDLGFDLDYPMYLDISVIGSTGEEIEEITTSKPIAPAAAVQTAGDFLYVNLKPMALDLESKINTAVDDWFQAYAPHYPSIGRYRSKFRVRSVLTFPPSGLKSQRPNAYMFIGQVDSIRGTGRGSKGQQSIVSNFAHINAPQFHPDNIYGSSYPFVETAGTGYTHYERYFNLEYDPPGPAGDAPQTQVPALNVTLRLRTGPYGLEPTIPWNLDNAGEARVEVDNFKSAKIIEIPLGMSNIMQVADLPPQFPDASLYPMKGSSNKIKILLNENSHKVAYQPIPIEPGDITAFADARIAQGRPVPKPILFGSDDSVIKFEIFRTTTRPSLYTDFAGHKIQTLDTITAAGQNVRNAAFIDRIEPNRDYYYCFRTTDLAGQVSNPSSILRVQMVDNNGMIYPIIEPYDMPLPNIRSSEKSFRRYLQIDASLDEKRIHLGDPSNTETAGSLFEPPNITNELSIGLASGSVFDAGGSGTPGTNVKVRIISKDTGRKLDLNLNFNIEAIRNPNLQGN